MMRQRKRQVLASILVVRLAHDSQNQGESRTMFDLRVIQSDCLLRVAAPYMPGLRCLPERRKPPQRENHEPNKEKPSLYWTSRLFHVVKP